MNITIIGLGVIGGSLGLAVKQNIPSSIVTGVDRPAQIRKALQRDAVDFGTASVSASVRDADIVFLCAPVSVILSLLPEISSAIKPSAIVTDVGSTKATVTAAAKKYFTGRGLFVGGHPMAGSEGKGIEFADALLFQNATYVLCSSPSIRKKISPLANLLHTIGARVLFLSARQHDEVAAAISHLPQLLAVALMNIVGKKNKRHPAYLQLAAGGFRDMTRIASSPYEIWKDILANNSSEIQKVIREFRMILAEFERDIAVRPEKFLSRFASAKSTRDAIPKNSKGFLHPLHDILVSVDDRPGVLSSITASLAHAKINIKDIELLKIRDGRGGTFRISFENRKDAGKAKRTLRRRNITVL